MLILESPKMFALNRFSLVPSNTAMPKRCTSKWRRCMSKLNPRSRCRVLPSVFSQIPVFQAADECYGVMTKKFKHEPLVWLQFARFRYRQRDGDGARALLQRALQVIDKPKRNQSARLSCSARALNFSRCIRY